MKWDIKQISLDTPAIDALLIIMDSVLYLLLSNEYLERYGKERDRDGNKLSICGHKLSKRWGQKLTSHRFMRFGNSKMNEIISDFWHVKNTVSNLPGRMPNKFTSHLGLVIAYLDNAKSRDGNYVKLLELNTKNSRIKNEIK